jgi:hypothetical protein
VKPGRTWLVLPTGISSGVLFVGLVTGRGIGLFAATGLNGGILRRVPPETVLWRKPSKKRPFIFKAEVGIHVERA